MQACGTRRAVIRSEKFMEWQRELSSTRAAYGGRRRTYDEMEAATINGIKGHQKKRNSSDEEAAKGSKGSEEMDVGGELPEINTTKARVKKQQQQQQCEQPDSKRLLDPKSKKVEACDPKDTEGGRLRRCKQAGMLDSQRDDPLQQIQQQTCPNQPTRSRTQHVPSADQDLQSSKRNAVGETAAFVSLPSNRGSKRSRRAARRLAYEEPQPPPLKLPKLHLVLTRKEIQDDWIKITGHKYSGKPKKSTLIQLGLGLCTSLTCPSTIRYLHDPQ